MLSELANYLIQIKDLRTQVIAQLQGLTVNLLNWRSFGQDSGSEFYSMAIFVTQIIGAEQFGSGEKAGILFPPYNRDPEFKTIAHNIIDLTRLFPQIP